MDASAPTFRLSFSHRFAMVVMGAAAVFSFAVMWNNSHERRRIRERHDDVLERMRDINTRLYNIDMNMGILLAEKKKTEK